MKLRTRRTGLLATLALALLPAAAPAATLTVNTDADTVANDGTCSLREAITAANANAPSGAASGECAAGEAAPDVVAIRADEYVLSRAGANNDNNNTGDLDVTSDLTLAGEGAATTTIDADELDRVLHIVSGTVTVRGLTITGGLARNGTNGLGQISLVPGGNATGGTGSIGQSGGGIYNTGTLTVEDSRIVGNQAGNGGLGGSAGGGDANAAGGAGGDATGGSPGSGGNGGGIAGGPLTVIRTLVTGNVAGDGGDADDAFGGDGFTGAANSNGGAAGDGTGATGGSGGNGGGIYVALEELTIRDSTITGNTAGLGGEGGPALGGRGGNGNGTGNGAAGGPGDAGNGGTGGAAGGVFFFAQAITISNTTIRDNTAGDGGPAGVGSGGDGGNGGGGGTGTTGGQGGIGLGGSGGGGGVAGGVGGLGNLNLIGSTVDGNVSGTGNDGATGNGGDGGNGGATNGDGGAGGAGPGGNGGIGGSAGGVFITGVDSVLENSTVHANGTGAGGAGGDGVGDDGGDATGTGFAGAGGNGNGGDGRDGGPGGGVASQSASTLRHVTVSENSTGDGGVLGEGNGGLSGLGDFAPPGFVTDGVDGAVGPGGGIFGDSANLIATLAAGNTPGNCADAPNTPDDGGANLSFPDATCPGINGDPKLGPLADNGGPTFTRALAADSAALGQVPSPCIDLDQRGLGRPGAGCDIGAYELGNPVAVTSLATGLSPTGARLLGAVTPSRRATTWFFEFGTSTGYGRRTPDMDAGDGPNPVDVGADIAGLTAATTYHFRLVASNRDGTSVGADQTFTTPIAPTTGGGDTTRPSFVSALLDPTTFAVNPRGAREIAVRSQKRRVRRGTTFRYQLSEPARVVFTIQRARSGRRVGGRCRARTKANRRRRKCTRFVRVGRFAQQATTTGTITKRFSGRIGRRSLKPGRHRAVLVATDAAGNKSTAKRLRFRIVRRR